MVFLGGRALAAGAEPGDRLVVEPRNKGHK